MGDNSSPPANLRRAVLGVVGLAIGLVAILVGLNVLSGSDAPPADTPRVQTGSLPTGTARVGTAPGATTPPSPVSGASTPAP